LSNERHGSNLKKVVIKSMKAQQLKSQIISESSNNQIDYLIQQLDNVRHIAESGFWISTDELRILLSLDDRFIDNLNKQVGSPIQDYRFSWRNFDCILVDRQFGKGFWAIRIKQDVLPSTDHHSAQIPTYLPTIQDPQPSTNNESSVLKVAPSNEIIPSPYALIDDFLSSSQLNDLLRYSIRKQPEFIPTTNSAYDPNYRRSFCLAHFPEFSELMIQLVRKITPQIITHLNINNFAIGQIESQMTAHNHGNYYKLHNDNGSPDSATRVLTYVYYYYREPKPFTGGELVIYDSKIENGYSVAAESRKVIQPTNNTIIFFPSHCMHEVLPVSCPSEYFADSRFTINGWVRHV
jgi:Rps23 Pro-64 3,4-dihydroxylase Tpa1-like proline 4-hydroxylase